MKGVRAAGIGGQIEAAMAGGLGRPTDLLKQVLVLWVHLRSL